MFFVWTKPGVALGLAEKPVEEGVVAVIVHGHGLEQIEGVYDSVTRWTNDKK